MECPSCKHNTGSSWESFPQLQLRFKLKDVDFPQEVEVYKYEDYKQEFGILYVCPKCNTVIFI